MNACADCGKKLTCDEIAITKKMINRAATVFYCKACLAARFRIPVSDVDRLIENFRKAGCSLFN